MTTAGLLGQKIGMTQIFDEAKGIVVPVTVIKLGPCTVLQVRSPDRDGYSAVQLGYGDKKRTRASRSERGHVARLDSKRNKNRSAAGVELPAKADCEPKKFVREFRLAEKSDSYEVGQEITAEVFAEIKSVDVTATSKGRGFAGVMKRHGFKGQRATHGVKKVHRHHGSLGMNQSPGHIQKGKPMPGQMGNEQVTVRNIQVVRVDAENGLLLIHGGVPGPRDGYVMVRPTNMLG